MINNNQLIFDASPIDATIIVIVDSLCLCFMLSITVKIKASNPKIIPLTINVLLMGINDIITDKKPINKFIFPGIFADGRFVVS